jgi:hypothetical protein
VRWRLLIEPRFQFEFKTSRLNSKITRVFIV